MRNLHECQAEVFRRSEKRIKERKQRRNHILMACVPLVLCLTIFGAFLFPQLYNYKQAPESMPDPFGTQPAMGQDDYQSLTCSISEIKVSGNGVSSYYTSIENVQGIMRLIHGIVAVPETNDGDGLKDNITDESTSTDTNENNKKNCYTILVKRSDGTSAEYLLVGSLLIDQTTQQEYPVNGDTMKDLKNALGIPLN